MRTIIDTTAGAGESLKAGGDKINAMAAELYAKADSLMGGRKARIGTMGESHGMTQGLVPAIMYSLWRYYPADVNFDYRTAQDGANFDAAKGDIYAIGGTTTDQLVSTQLPKIEAAIASGRTYDLVYIVSGYNDQVNSLAKSETVAANILQVVARLRAAGVRLIVLCGVFPRGGTSLNTEDCNTRLRIAAATMAGVAFCDLTRVMADPTSPANVFKFKGVDGQYLGYSTDGTHAAGYARRMIARELEHYHRAIARRRVPRRGFNSGAFDQVNAPGADVTGDAGNMMMSGNGGLFNGAFTTNVAGDGHNGCLDITVSGSGVTVTPSLVVGADGFRKQRLTFGGTAGGDVIVRFHTLSSITNLNNGVLTRGYDSEMLVDLVGVSGLADLVLSAGPLASRTPSFGTNAPADLWPDTTTESLFMYTAVPETYPANQGNPGPQLIMQFNSRTPAGYLDISRWSMRRVVD